MYLILQPKKVIWDLLYFDWNSFFIMWNSNPEHIFISLKLMFFQHALGQRSAKRMKYIGKAHCWGFFCFGLVVGFLWFWYFCVCSFVLVWSVWVFLQKNSIDEDSIYLRKKYCPFHITFWRLSSHKNWGGRGL